MGDAPTNRANTQVAIANIAQRTPAVPAFVLDNDQDFIYVGHSPSVYPANPSEPIPFDNHLVVLVGRTDDLVTPVILPAAAFERTGPIRAGNIAMISGAAGHAAAPPVLRLGPHAGGAADTDELRARRAMLVPPAVGVAALQRQSGRYGLAKFLVTFLAPAIAAGGDLAAIIAPLVQWYRVASTNTAGAVPATQIAAMTPGNPAEAAKLKPGSLLCVEAKWHVSGWEDPA